MLLTPVAGLVVAGVAIAFAEGTGRGSSEVLFSGQSALPELVLHAAGWTVGALMLLVVCKSIAYAVSLSSFRGGPVFPSMFIGAAAGVAASHLPGLSLVPGVAMGIGAMCTVMLKLPMTSTLLATLLLASDGINVIPVVIVAVVVAYVATAWLPQTPAELRGLRSAGAGDTAGAPPAATPRRRWPRHRRGPAATTPREAAHDLRPHRRRGGGYRAGRWRCSSPPWRPWSSPATASPGSPGSCSRWPTGCCVHRWGNEDRQANLRALYAPIALVSLPLVWMLSVTVGFSFIFWGIDTGNSPALLRDQRLVPVHPGVRRAGRAPARIWLTFVEATIGLGLVALLISYLPTIYAAHHQREKGISVLRPFAGTPPSPVDTAGQPAALGRPGQPRPVADRGQLAARARPDPHRLPRPVLLPRIVRRPVVGGLGREPCSTAPPCCCRPVGLQHRGARRPRRPRAR